VTEAEIEVLRDQYAAVNERDWARAMSHYAENVELVVPGSGLNTGTFTGKDAVGDWFGDWMATFDRDLHFEIREITELRDGSLLLIADHRARGRASGVELEAPVVWRYWLRDGKIVRVGGFESLEEALRLAEEEKAPD
jgi:ketosteroid isomerase-like protein